MYWVQTTYTTNCVSRDTINFPDTCMFKLNVFNVFTPNGDGKNDVYRCSAVDSDLIVSFHMEIYNRWGLKLFDSNNLDSGWDGTYIIKKCLPVHISVS